MKRWFISDTHFSHKNIIRYAGRPYTTVDEMNKRIRRNRVFKGLARRA